MVRCGSGHQPLAMFGRRCKTHNYMTCDYGRSYGPVAADAIEGHGRWLSVREDALLPLVERFFAEPIFGPMRLEKLAVQLRAHEKKTAKSAKDGEKRLRAEIEDLDRRIGLQIEALEQELAPALVSKRIAQLEQEKEKAQEDLRGLAPSASNQGSPEDLEAALGRLPDLAQALRDAPPALKRQVFEAFELRILYDKVDRRIEVSATITETVAKTLENAKDLPEEALAVAPTDIAGAGFEPATFGL